MPVREISGRFKIQDNCECSEVSSGQLVIFSVRDGFTRAH